MNRLHRLRLGALGALVAALLSFAGCESPAVALTPDEVVDAFVTLAKAPDRTMHMELTGHIGGFGGMSTPFSMVADFSGDDYVAVMTMSSGLGEGSASRVELAMVGGRGFTRYAFAGTPAGWEASDGMPTTIDPLRLLPDETVRYVGEEDADAGKAHHLRVTDPTALAGAFFGGAGPGIPMGIDGSGGDSALEIYVDTMGKPLAASLTITMSQPELGGSMRLVGHYQFSDWGQPITILPPLR